MYARARKTGISLNWPNLTYGQHGFNAGKSRIVFNRISRPIEFLDFSRLLFSFDIKTTAQHEKTVFLLTFLKLRERKTNGDSNPSSPSAIACCLFRLIAYVYTCISAVLFFRLLTTIYVVQLEEEIIYSIFNSKQRARVALTTEFRAIGSLIRNRSVFLIIRPRYPIGKRVRISVALNRCE